MIFVGASESTTSTFIVGLNSARNCRHAPHGDAPPRLATAPAAFECRRTVGMAFGPQRELLIGEVLGVHAREGIVDPATLNVDFAALAPVGRLCGNMYARQRDMFELKRITYAEWRARRSKVQA